MTVRIGSLKSVKSLSQIHHYELFLRWLIRVGFDFALCQLLVRKTHLCLQFEQDFSDVESAHYWNRADYRRRPQDPRTATLQQVTFNPQSAGGIPLIMPPLKDSESIAKVVDQVEGFVLIGGMI